MNRAFRVSTTLGWMFAGLLVNGCAVVQQLADQPKPPNAGADAVVWQVSYGGGMTSLPNALSGRPVITVYGDGRYLVPHVDTAHSSPSPVTTFDEGQLSDDDLAALEQAVATSRVFDDSGMDLGLPMVSDAGMTSVRGLDADGRPAELHAYALGDGGLSQLTQRQRDLRDRLDALVQEMTALLPDTGDTAYVPRKLEVFGIDDLYPVDGARRPHPWPGPPHTALFAGLGGEPTCAVVAGAEVAPVLHASQHNPDLTWADSAGEFAAVVRIALPAEHPCD